jgi:hypothetical protein
MSGGLSVPLTLAAVYFDSIPARAGFAAMAAIAFVSASFSIWRTQHAKIEELEKKVEKLSTVDISWAWEFVGGELRHDPNSETMAWQIRLTIRNRTTSTVASFIAERSILIEQTPADIILRNSESPGTTTPGATMTILLPPYSAMPIFKQAGISGQIDIAINYGLPEKDLSRIAVFPLSFTVDLGTQIITKRGTALIFPVEFRQRSPFTDRSL